MIRLLDARKPLGVSGPLGTLLELAGIVELRDLYDVGHAKRVGELARAIGESAGLSAPELETLYVGGVLHDLGKVALPDEILRKPDFLCPDERAVVERHPAEGEVLCRGLHVPRECLAIVRHHHERFDGTGYPDRLPGSSIPKGARIVAVADAWEAMLSARPYRPALSTMEASHRLRTGAAVLWDPIFVELCLRLRARPGAEQP